MTVGVDPLRAPDGTPWCHFRSGLLCRNGDDCRNPNHRYTLHEQEPEPPLAL